MVICLKQGANDLHMVQLMPLPPHHLLLHGLPFWWWLTQAVLEKRLSNGHSSSNSQSTITWLMSSSGTTDAGRRGRDPTMTPDPRPLPTALTTRPRGRCGMRVPAAVLA